MPLINPEKGTHTSQLKCTMAVGAWAVNSAIQGEYAREREECTVIISSFN